MPDDESMLCFRKDPGFIGDWSNVAEQTYDLLAILRYCASDEMNYKPEAKAKIQALHDWIESTGCGDDLTEASNMYP